MAKSVQIKSRLPAEDFHGLRLKLKKKSVSVSSRIVMDFMDIGEHDIRRNHIPLVWLGGAVRQPRQIDVICNQTDLPATLLGQMHLPHQTFRYSRDVVSKNYTAPFATHTFNNGISMVDSTGLAVYDLNINKITVAQSPAAQQMIHVGQLVLQAAAKDIKKLP